MTINNLEGIKNLFEPKKIRVAAVLYDGTFVNQVINVSHGISIDNIGEEFIEKQYPGRKIVNILVKEVS